MFLSLLICVSSVFNPWLVLSFRALLRFLWLFPFGCGQRPRCVPPWLIILSNCRWLKCYDFVKVMFPPVLRESVLANGANDGATFYHRK